VNCPESSGQGYRNEINGNLNFKWQKTSFGTLNGKPGTLEWQAHLKIAELKEIGKEDVRMEKTVKL